MPLSKGQDKKGRFTAGNQAARRGGEKMKTRMIRVIGEKGLDKLLAAEFKSAKSGDVNSRQFLLGRILPPMKATQPPVNFDLDLSSLDSAAASILASIANGALAPDVGQSLLSALKNTAEISTIQQLTQKVADLQDQVDAQCLSGGRSAPVAAIAPEHTPTPADEPTSPRRGITWLDS